MTDIEIIAEPGVPQVIVVREFAATPEVLFRAYTEADLLARWIGPRGYQTTVDVLEPRDGGRWRYTVRSKKCAWPESGIGRSFVSGKMQAM